MSPHPHPFEGVLRAAKRLTTFAAWISEAHALGHGPGHISELWSRDFHDQALTACRDVLPQTYLADLGLQYQAISRSMARTGAPADTGDEWLIVSDFLRNCSEAIFASQPEVPGLLNPRPFPTQPPVVIPFDHLGRLGSAAGAQRLWLAGEKVRTALDQEPHRANPLTPDQIDLLSLVVTGNSVAQISAKANCSPRTVFRRLEATWRSVGADSRAEGIATIMTHGWLDESPQTMTDERRLRSHFSEG